MTIILDGTTGITSPADSLSGNLTFTGTGNRITGDFSNATVANRVLCQTSTTNGYTLFGVMPSGTAVISQFQAYNSSDADNNSMLQLAALGSFVGIYSSKNGTGTYLPMTFYTGGSERMRIDTSGNVGIGTSSPSSFPGKLSVIGDGIVTDYDLISRVSSSLADADRGFKQITDGTGQFSIYSPNGGGVVFGVGSSYTERMRIGSSGNVGIGTSSPSSKLEVADANAIIKSTATSGFASFYANAATGNQAYNFFAVNGTEVARIGSDATNSLFFATGSSATERMRIDSSGNVGIGTSSPVYKLEVRTTGDAVQIYASNGTVNQAVGYCSAGLAISGAITNHPYVFLTNNTERARIDSSGNLMVGTTSTGFSNSWSHTLEVGSKAYHVINHPSGAGSGSGYVLFGYNGSSIGNITQNGTTAVAYNTSSDYRLKENIAPMTDALSVVAQLKPCTYTWKADGSDGQGFIAHELQAVVPDCVTGEKDAVDAEGNPVYQGIDTSFLVATLTAAIQEQQAIIEQLRADVEQLKGKA